MTRRDERGFTLVEIMIVVSIIALLAAIAIPNVLRGRTTANESAAIGNLRALVSSLEMYRSVNNAYPANGAAAWQDDMYVNADPDFGPPSFSGDLVAGATIQGYDYTFVGVAAGTTYTLNAVPNAVGTTGTRAFLATESGLIRHCNAAAGAGVATAASPTIDAAVADCP